MKACFTRLVCGMMRRRSISDRFRALVGAQVWSAASILCENGWTTELASPTAFKTIGTLERSYRLRGAHRASMLANKSPSIFVVARRKSLAQFGRSAPAGCQRVWAHILLN